jgi:uridine phosphorylase
MTTKLSPADLILTEDKRIYHLKLRPTDIADTIILVGDPGRVAMISQHFDRIELSNHDREFITHTGWLGKKRLTVMSTGMSTANLDIAINELDALANIDFETRLPIATPRSLKLIRLGTAGSLQADIPLDSFVVSTHGVAIDNLLLYYDLLASGEEQALTDAFHQQTTFADKGIQAKIIAADPGLLHQLTQDNSTGMTVTCPGFYAPQQRYLRAKTHYPTLIDELNQFKHQDHRITNFEMETAALYGLGKLLGHQCVSISAIVANRMTHQFSSKPKQTVEQLITFVLTHLEMQEGKRDE